MCRSSVRSNGRLWKSSEFQRSSYLYNFHFMNFLCPGKEWIQIKPLSFMYLQTGFFHLPHGDFFIEPVKKHPLAEGEYHPHIIYRRQRRGIPEVKEPTCGLKGIVLNLLTGWGSLFCSIFFFFSLCDLLLFKSVFSSQLFGQKICTLIHFTSLYSSLYS